ncbi:MAG: trimethylamine methyltransferase family protein [Desulfobacula sp.]|jgi:trimethylamine--corrinoid protein Co-methyltransferase|nr:trimethylamine methyltransferase family protein [Desulfobacula sp.]
MLANHFNAQIRPRLQLLNQDQIKQIHLASLEILERTGVQVMLPEALDLLEKAGAWILSDNMVKIPSHLVEEALRSAPSRITIYDRNGSPAMRFEGLNTHFGPGTDTTFVMDIETGERRSTKGQDVARVARLCDALPNIDFVASMGGVSPEECDPNLSDRHNFALMLNNTTKPILFTSWSLEGLKDIHRMASVVCGSKKALEQKPFLIHYAEPITPLQHAPESLQKLLFCAENFIPCAYVSAPIMGATSPVTVAGTLALQTAEFLSGLVISQLKRKGAPILYGGGGTPMDMKTSVNVYSGPEAFLVHVAGKEMATYYGLPDFNTGGCSDAKVLDQQAAAEASVSLMQASMAGSSMVHDVGYLESGLTASYEMLVLSDELIDMLKYILKGVTVDAESLATDIINKVGPRGNYLQEKHTVQNFRNIWYPKLFNRANHERWKEGGGKDLWKVLNERVKTILGEHKPEPLAKNVMETIEGILASKMK